MFAAKIVFFFNRKVRLCAWHGGGRWFFSLLLLSLFALQGVYAQTDSTQRSADTVARQPRRARAGGSLDAPVDSDATDSICYFVKEKKVEMYGSAKLKYRNQEFESGFMELDMNRQQLFAHGLKDSLGGVREEPQFKDGTDSYSMEGITYNFNSGKARISGVMTKVTEGYLHGEIIKRMPNEEINVAGGKFTTCDQRDPHFYIALTRAKVIPNEKIFTDVAYLVLAGVPTPLVIPFGFFPNTHNRSSGIIMPEYGEERSRGFFIRNGGFYLGLSDYVDLMVLGGVYTKGSWDVSLQSRYALRYRFTGSVNFAYSSIQTGQEGTPSQTSSSTYRVTWTHMQDRATHPNSTFQANVTFGSSSYNRYNSRNTDEFMNNQIMSSISYSRTFPGTPFSVSTSLNHSQNTRDSIVNIRFPQLAVNMARIYPFKRESSGGKARWYEKIGLNYNMNLQNDVRVKEDRLFTDAMYRGMRNGVQHRANLSTAFTLLKFLTFSPYVNYQEEWYIKSARYEWDESLQRAVRDTVSGFARGWQFSTGIGTSTKLYGMYTFGKDAKVRAIRHVLTPTVGFTYHPDFAGDWYGFYREMPGAKPGRDGKIPKYSIFEGGIFGGPPRGKSGSVSLGLGNSIEMKVRDDKDSVSGSKKIPILQSLNFSTLYNFMADSMNWSNLNISANTSLFNFLNVSANSSFSPYSCNENGAEYDRFYYEETKKPLRFLNLSLGCGFSLREVLTGEKGTGIPYVPLGYLPGTIPFSQARYTDYRLITYEAFKAPWDISVSYNFSYNKRGSRISTYQTATIRSGFSVGESWSFSINTGYDLNALQFSTTSLSVNRDLHCWQMSLNVVPFGMLRSFTFRINVKSALLKDLKYDKKRDYVDNLLP